MRFWPVFGGIRGSFGFRGLNFGFKWGLKESFDKSLFCLLQSVFVVVIIVIKD